MRSKKADIIKKLLILFNVKPSPTTETKFFRKLRNQQEELDNAFEYWLDQSKMVFGEVAKVDEIHGMKEAGIDLLLNLMSSKFRFGVQVKTFGDIKKKNFSNQVLSQKSLSLKHRLSCYLVAFAGDMTDRSQNLKVRSIISELSQEGDNYVIPLSPEKVLTIYKIYKLNRHPLKHVFLDYTEALVLLSGVTDNLNNEQSNVQIKLKIKNLKKDNVSRPHKFKMGLAFDKDSKDKLKILDDLKNQAFTDEVIKIDKSTVDSFKDRVSLTGIKPSKEEADHILNTMLNLSEIIIFFDDRSFIQNIYSIEYRNFFTILSVLLRSTDVDSRKIGKKISVLEDDSPRFQFLLKKLEPGTDDNTIKS